MQGARSSQTPSHVLKCLILCMSKALVMIPVGRIGFTGGCIRTRGFSLYMSGYNLRHVICAHSFNTVKSCHLQPFLLSFLRLLVYKVIIMIQGMQVCSHSSLRVLSVSGSGGWAETNPQGESVQTTNSASLLDIASTLPP